MEHQFEQLRCEDCGATVKPGTQFCPCCGQRVATGIPHPVKPESDPAAQVSIRHMSKQEYRKVCKNEKYLRQIKSAAIICYICAGINVVLALMAMSVFPLVDVAITVPLAIIMHTNKSKGCAIALLVYSIIGSVVNLVVNGTAGGWLWLVAAVSAVSAFSISDKEYEAAKQNDQTW